MFDFLRRSFSNWATLTVFSTSCYPGRGVPSTTTLLLKTPLTCPSSACPTLRSTFSVALFTLPTAGLYSPGKRNLFLSHPPFLLSLTFLLFLSPSPFLPLPFILQPTSSLWFSSLYPSLFFLSPSPPICFFKYNVLAGARATVSGRC